MVNALLEKRKTTSSPKKHSHVNKEITKQTSPKLLLKPTPMGRICKDVIQAEGRAEKFSNGLEWEKKPRQTRNTTHMSVSRKTGGSVDE